MSIRCFIIGLDPVNKTKNVKDHCKEYLNSNLITTKDATKGYQEFQKVGKKKSKIATIFVFVLIFIGSLLFL